MTGPEIAHSAAFGANPIVLVIDNGGWGIFRPVAERPDLLTIPRWPYADLAHAWGGRGFTVRTTKELRQALSAAETASTFSIIHVELGYADLSPISQKYIKAAAKRSQPAKNAHG